MKLSIVPLAFLFLFVLLCGVDAKRYSGGGGGSRRGSSSSSGSRWGSIFGSSKPKPQVQSRPALPTSFGHDSRTSSSNFLKSESYKPSAPVSFSRPSNPPHSAPNFGGSHFSTHPSAPPKSTGIVHESHQKSGVNNVHSSNPYSQQPAHNPYLPNGQSNSHIPPPPSGVSLPTGYNTHHGSNPPYPLNPPNHPHPNPGLTSSHYPSSHNYPPPPYSPGPVHPQSYPNVHGPPPPYSGPSYHPHAQYQPAYSAPPPSAPFVPGRTIVVVPESGKTHSSGPGLGTYIASGVAGGVAAGATNAIVDHAISSIFRPSANHVHTYPNPPAPGTPSTVTNNYYYGQSGTGDNTGHNNAPVNGQPGPVQGQPGPVQAQPGSVPSQPGSANGPVEGQPGISQSLPTIQANPGVATDGKGNPSSATNGAVVQTPENQPETPAPSQKISDEDLMKFTEELFEKQDKNLNQHVELNLQKRVSKDNAEQGKPVPDEASEPLFNLKPELDSIPTVSALRALYDNYERDGTKNEVMTPEKRQEESTFLEEVVKTPVMSRALEWLVQNKFVEPDEYEKKDVLRRMWFTTFDNTSSGFERIFLSEKFGDSGIVGMQNWLYFANLEAQKNVNYLGYVEMTSLSGKGSLLKLNYQTEGFTIQNATIFVGTPPELELALYTVCFYARPNEWCPVSIGGAKFFILTHSFRYYGKDLIDLGFPAVSS